MSDAVIEAAHRRYVEACWYDLEARWRLRAGGRLIVRGHSHTGGTVADTKVGETLDGMTVAQLRDLARRAEAAAKVQEEKAQFIETGVEDYRVRRSDGAIFAGSRGPYYPHASKALMCPRANAADVALIGKIFCAVADKKWYKGWVE